MRSSRDPKCLSKPPWVRAAACMISATPGPPRPSSRIRADASSTIRWCVLEGGPEVLLRHSERTLLLCWPDPWSGFDEASLLAYPGEHVALVGEPGEEGPGSEGFQARLQWSWRRIE